MDGTGELFGPLLKVIPQSLPRRVVSYPPDRPRSYAELGSILDEQLADAGELVVVAESFSGPLAVRYAAAHPGRVRAVVLCASFIRPPAPGWLRLFARPALFRLPMPKFVLKRLMAGRDAPDSLLRSVNDAVRKVAPEVLAARVREVLRVDCSEELRRSRVPVLYLGASRDAIVKRSSWEAVQAVRPDVELNEVDAPHLALQTAPEVAWNEIAKFLNASVSKGQH
jgi:pimeloyl-ACP methyl ester carboxylesterase